MTVPGVRRWHAIAGSMAVLLLCGCGADGGRVVVIDGSSSLYPLTEAVSEAFAREHPAARVVIRVSGSGGGLRRLCEDEADIAAASRLMTAAEMARCRAAGRRFLSLPVARDGVVMVVNSANDAVACLTLAELGRIWGPEAAVTTWRDLRPALPAERVRLFGPGPDSGTFRFFTRVVVGRPGASRTDYYRTEDDHLVARGVAGDRWSLGYFGSANHTAHSGRLRMLAVDTGFGCVLPTPAAIRDGRYSPLSRDLHLYVKSALLADQDVFDFIEHFVSASELLASETGYTPLPAAEYSRNRALLSEARSEALGLSERDRIGPRAVAVGAGRARRRAPS
ncbi:MAG: PstS family phosphate ABC transporter substrate-binding protein [Gemmatimonadetes bacterium]|nr:PstS family phosphate ABC transporter substrate-binding protein [Gemmatimonadota bacterium]MYA44674.1 PstS family phosphate ABC transporter substrate-binding protein [Gemmatimonadota bacterium]MYE92829.1 PstS family phosphate ABC transporter substrate-binding protein [Gemmatimonadota bacterium]MYJ11301.1 PstS family phosphate ABC transporter substrate-binding protein [Gemmatimonadota bacterium]